MRKDLGEILIQKKSVEIDMDINRRRKGDVKKAIQELIPGYQRQVTSYN